MPLQGGVPIESYGVVIGAIGVSGATDADEDRELAELGARSLQAAIAARANGGSSDGAAHFPAAAVDEKFRAGGLLLDDARRTRSTRAAARAPARSSTTSTSST